MACTASSDLHMFTPSAATEANAMPRPPIVKTNVSFESLPTNDLQLLWIPEIITDEGSTNFDSSCFSYPQAFLKPKVRASKRKRMFDDLLLKMAGQGSTKLDIFNREREASQAGTHTAKRIRVLGKEDNPLATN
ncbi:expressed unknown protein [Seminavis robusta]|uniref:Uncharacterized protein n=1 Tax=Seminavis robusta TaxID=568900 RepID=A0A9N8EB36_9STRA|nr:expressed unknown protein [Seminavis robusta]|eukprot:Sro866_g213010.1 n/a (134) ;mRNA; r:21207-21608